MRTTTRLTITAVCVLVLTTLALGAGAADVEAQGVRLFGTQGFGRGANSVLVEIDPATGAILQTIGPVGYTVNGLDFDATTGKLYGSTSNHSFTYFGFNGLLEIDMATGAGTPVGAPNWGTSSTSSTITNITVDSTGQLYGYSENIPSSPAFDDLMRIDKATGIATWVGESFAGSSGHSLSFDANDDLYLVTFGPQVFSVDTVSGVATYLYDVPNLNLDYGFIRFHHGDFHPATNLFYGLGAPYPSFAPRTLVTIDLDTRTGTAIGNVGDVHTLAFIADAEPPAPAVGGFAVGELVGVDVAATVPAPGRPWMALLTVSVAGLALLSGAFRRARR